MSENLLKIGKRDSALNIARKILDKGDRLL
jgi:hypothetical protein